jgi:hypothetical protein
MYYIVLIQVDLQILPIMTFSAQCSIKLKRVSLELQQALKSGIFFA